MSDPRRRAVLEGIAYGTDSAALERIRALELLDQLDSREGVYDFEDELPPRDDPAAIDAALAEAGFAVVSLDEPESRPQELVDRVECEVARLGRERTRGLDGRGSADEGMRDARQLRGPSDARPARRASSFAGRPSPAMALPKRLTIDVDGALSIRSSSVSVSAISLPSSSAPARSISCAQGASMTAVGDLAAARRQRLGVEAVPAVGLRRARLPGSRFARPPLSPTPAGCAPTATTVPVRYP